MIKRCALITPCCGRFRTNAQATKQNMISGIKDLLAGNRAGGVLVFTNSSHGTYCADKSGDEPKYDEALRAAHCH